MLTAVPLPDKPLTVLWQSTVVDIEPGSRYGYRHDAAAINTTLAVLNDTGDDLTFPMILATTDPEPRDDSHRSIRVGGESPGLSEASDVDIEWATLAASTKQNALAQGYTAERVDAYLALLRREVRRAYKSEQITIKAGQERFIRSHQRKLLLPRDGIVEFRGIFPLPQFVLARGGSISVQVALPRAVQRVPVDLIDWTRNYTPQAFGKDAGLPAVAGRHVVSWFWQNDPELHVTYRYAG